MRSGPLKRNKKSLWIAAAAAAASQVPNAAHAAGTDVPDNGAGVISRGGTYSSQLDTAYALQFNPAGMTRVDGLDIRIDYRWVFHDITFQRDKSKYYAGGFDTVSNGSTPFGSPSAGLVYHPTSGPLRKFAFGVGAWGPSGVGKYSFADPRSIAKDFAAKNSRDPDSANYNPTYDDDYDAAVAKGAPQRYSQVRSDQFIMYPSLGVAWQPHEKFSVGVTFQMVYADIQFDQSLGINLLPGQEGEQPKNDAFVSLKTKQAMTAGRPTGIFGATFEPMKGLVFNASFRPKVYIEADGTVDVTLPESITNPGHETDPSKVKPLAKVEGNSAKLSLKLPPVLRVGASYKRGRLNTAAEFRYEGWSANDQFKVETGVMVVPALGEKTAVGTLIIKNNWKDSFGGRIGAGYDILQPADDKILLQANAGALFESNAVPSTQQSVPFVAGNRGAVSAGLTVGYKGFGVTAGAMYYFPVTMTVTDSKQEQATSTPANVTDENRVIVGNGIYNSKVFMATVGLSYTGLGSAK